MTPTAKLEVNGNAFVSGNVGIGINYNPIKAKVQIEGSLSRDLYYGYSYLVYRLDSGSGRIETGIAGGSNIPYSLYASDRIACIEFNAFSDARIKEVKGISNSSTDLETLLQIKITDYYYKDQIANDDRQHKKVIGQQVATVFPQAVSTHTDVVPDIFQPASITNGWISLPEHGLKIGEQVRLLLEGNDSKICTIDAVTSESFQVSLDYEGEVFVYGREVDDYHVVDYDALSMLHISATQELYNIIVKLQQEVQQLKHQIGEITETK